MTRRKGEITARMNERDYPHIIEAAAAFGWLPIQVRRYTGLPSRARHRAPPGPRVA